MGLGAAGCGYEYDNRCPFLNITEALFGKTFTCAKYRVELEKNRTIGHPFRCKKCSDEADAYWTDERVKEFSK
jgi:hypothetical protein